MTSLPPSERQQSLKHRAKCQKSDRCLFTSAQTGSEAILGATPTLKNNSNVKFLAKHATEFTVNSQVICPYPGIKWVAILEGLLLYLFRKQKISDLSLL